MEYGCLAAACVMCMLLMSVTKCVTRTASSPVLVACKNSFNRGLLICYWWQRALEGSEDAGRAALKRGQLEGCVSLDFVMFISHA
jgi:hypothetical protein